ncbi:MAG: Lpg1974 family pore-forming outer membrane protein [Pirellulales bacterium]|nr:Lpg1974 family pore-forming outer membrane protein [Pirellulales bacterium]
MSAVRHWKLLNRLFTLGLALGVTAAPLLGAEHPQGSQSGMNHYRRVTAEVAGEHQTATATPTRATPRRATSAPGYQVAPVAYNTASERTIPARDTQVRPVGHHHGSSGGCTTGNCETGDCADGSCTSAPCDTCDTGDCGESCISDCLTCNYFAQNGWYFGAEFLYLTTNYSEPVAAVERSVVVDNNNNSTITDTTRNYEFGYSSNYRVNGGYRWGSCGEAINFSFLNFQDDTSYNSIAADPNNGVIIAGPLETNASNTGDRLVSNLDQQFNTFDLDYSKRIPICTCNNDPCSCCKCPPWALTWSAGVRVGDLERLETVRLFNAAGTNTAISTIDTQFVGAGPKIGLEGRRFLGESFRWSIFGKSNVALLLGDYDTIRTKVTGGGTATSVQLDNYRRVIPMLDIEVGFSRQIGKKTMFTAGYFFQAWWDLGMFESIEGTNFGPEDDSNIMAYDGLMLRVERVF